MMGTIDDIWNDYLAHHGVLGMKWGVRRYQDYGEGGYNPKKKGKFTGHKKKQYVSPHQISKERKPLHSVTKNGVSVDIYDDPDPVISRFLGKHVRGIADNRARTRNMHIEINGQNVGELQLYRESKTSMNGTWLKIDESERGKGYAQAVMVAWIKYAKDNGYKQLTLEVPKESPDARHIYEKMGFVAGKETDTGAVWGGSLTDMKLDLTKLKI